MPLIAFRKKLMMVPLLFSLLLTSFSWKATTAAFVRPPASSLAQSLIHPLPITTSTTRFPHGKSNTQFSSSSSSLHMSVPILSLVKNAVGHTALPLQKTVSPIGKRLLLVLGATMLFLSKHYKRVFWPGSGQDSKLKEPLPPGSFGCPFLGNNVLVGTTDYGPYVFFDKAARRYNNPNLLKLYAFGTPMVSVVGAENIKTVLKDGREFTPDGVNTELLGANYEAFIGGSSLLYESDRAKHASLRRLVGASMTPPAITKALPAIQKAANVQVDRLLLMLQSVSSQTTPATSSTTSPIKMEDICNDFTLDVAWRQILGLDLTEEEVPIFFQNVKQWLNGLFSPIFALPFAVPGLKLTKAYKARQYLVAKVEEKLAKLDANGPDGSTLSEVYFATDDSDADTGSASTTTTTRKLTREQVIDNALILIVAGSETSASTLTVASLLLGLHQDVWKELKEEQAAMIRKCGDTIATKAQLDAECPLLDAVIRETLRLRPVPTMEFRRTKTPIVLDGMQIPKNYMVVCNIRGTHDMDPTTYQEDGSHMDVKTGFQPDRWTDDATRPSSDWMPFGSGGRRCLGENLAMTEMKVFLATLARRVDYDLVRSPTDKVEWKRLSAMPRPLDGVEIVPREQAAPLA